MSNASQMNNVSVSELTSILRTELTSESVQTAGAILEAARKEHGWTIQQVSEQLKLSISQISALESNQYQSLPTLVIVRGFVRAYAKLLKIDPLPIISLLPIENQRVQLDDSLKPALSTPFIESKMSLLGRNDNNRRYILGAVFLAVLALLFLISQTSQVKNYLEPIWGSNQQSIQIKNEAHKFSEDLIQTTKIQTPVLVENEIDSDKVLSTSVADSVKKQESTIINSVPLTSKSEQNLTTESKVQELQESKDKDTLLLKFRENSWVQIKTEKGNVLFERIMLAGTQETFKVDQILQIKIGNAAGVDGWLRGSSLNIAPAGGSNVINLSLK